MAYEAFKGLVKEKGWTIGQLRCDEPPTPDLLEAMDRVGLPRWERFVLRLEKEQAA